MIRTTLCSRDSVAGKGGESDRWFPPPPPPAHTLPKCAVRSSARLLAFFSQTLFFIVHFIFIFLRSASSRVRLLYALRHRSHKRFVEWGRKDWMYKSTW